MKRVILAVALLAAGGAVAEGRTTEVLVSTSATAIPSSPLYLRKSVEVQNLGPNAIYCAFSSAGAVVSKARRLLTGESWIIEGASFSLWCVAATAPQVTGAATVVSELQ